jgi:hypothetical protein
MKKFGKSALPILAAAILFVFASAGSLWAATPEIDPSTGISAITLLAGVAVVIRGWRKR